MAKLQLNEKQKLWFKQFRTNHPNGTIKSKFKLDGNYRIEICWFENKPKLISKVHKNRNRRYPKSKKYQACKQLLLSIKI